MARIIIENFVNDGNNYLSFVHVKEGGNMKVATGYHERINDTYHVQLYETGVE